MHHIKVDPRTGVAEVTVTGFWTTADVAQFGRDMIAATADLRAKGRSHATLYDYSQAIIQSQEVVAAFQALALSMPAKSRRAALYTEGNMAKMQARRIASVRSDMEVFDNRADALAWLHEEEAAPLLRRTAGR